MTEQNEEYYGRDRTDRSGGIIPTPKNIIEGATGMPQEEVQAIFQKVAEIIEVGHEVAMRFRKH